MNDQIIDVSQSRGVHSFKILPWTELELGRLASYFLGTHNAPEFVTQFKSLTLDRATITPLLALIAICVYEQNLRTLPGTRAELYKLFIDNAILRALKRAGDGCPNWVTEAGQDFFVELLSQIGLLSARNLENDRADELDEWVQGEIQKREKLPDHQALKRAREFVQLIASGSGLIILDKGRWHWWHASVRDYLAAFALASESHENQLAALQLWDTSVWKEIIILMMVILSVKHEEKPNRYPDVTRLFRYLSGRYVGCGLLLYVALAEGAKVDEEMEEFVIDALVSGAINMGSVAECKAYNDELESQGRSPVELLAKMSDRQAAMNGLVRIRDAPNVEPWMRSQAERALKRQNRILQ